MPWTIFFWRYMHHTRHTSMILLQIWMMSLHAMQQKGWCIHLRSFCCWQTSLQKPPQTCHSKVAETEGWLLNGVGRNMAGNQRGAGIGNLLACGARVEICWDDRRDDSICPVELRSRHFTGQDLSRWFLNSYNLYRTFGMCNCLCSCCIMVRVATGRRRS